MKKPKTPPRSMNRQERGRWLAWRRYVLKSEGLDPDLVVDGITPLAFLWEIACDTLVELTLDREFIRLADKYLTTRSVPLR